MKLIEKNIPDSMRVSVSYQHSSEGGRLDATVATLYDRETGETVGVGRALVNHRKEKHPSRKIGRAIAIGRAMQMAGYRKSKKGGEPVVDWLSYAETGEWQV